MTQARDLADGKFDTDTLVVDAANNRVGVGTTSPADHLAVVASGANAHISVDRSDGATGRTVLIHSSSGGQLQTTGSAPLIFGTADTERGRFLSGGGLTFNGDTATANALDDYEEGTFTPNLKGTTTDPTVSYNSRYGTYTKVGNLVLCQISVDMSSVSGGSGSAIIGDLPFTAANNGANSSPHSMMLYNVNVASDSFAVALRTRNNAADTRLLSMRDANTWGNMSVGDFAGSSIVVIATVTYMAA